MTDGTDITLYLGGTRSGKSVAAERHAAMDRTRRIVYVATAVARPDDASMTDRIAKHRARRPESWSVLEIPTALGSALDAYLTAQREGVPATVLVDCVTMWVTNLMFGLDDPLDADRVNALVEAEVDGLCSVMARHADTRWILVSGETGLGGIAGDACTRVFTDALGLANQRLAAAAGEVFLVVAGRRLRLV